MDLSLNEASTLLGRSVRQLRYQLQKGEIQGSKVVMKPCRKHPEQSVLGRRSNRLCPAAPVSAFRVRLGPSGETVEKW